MLLLTFPELKSTDGLVTERLKAESAGEDVMNLWSDLVKQAIQSTDEDDEF
jgi:hypothetical protein